MRKSKSIATIALLLTALLLLSSCAVTPAAPVPAVTPAAAVTPEAPEAPAPEQTAAPAPEQTEVPAPEGTPTEEELGYIDRLYKDMQEQAETYAPKVTTLANGVQVQRTPYEYMTSVYHNPGESISYNTYYLKADQRGCNACHQDLAALLDGMTYDHVTLTNSFGIETTLAQCLDCHSYSPGYVTEKYGFGTLIHGIHNNQPAFTGDCMSCHTATGDGEGLKLWDLEKHNILRGILDVPNVEGEFSYNQDLTVSNEELFSFNWMYYDQDYERYGSEKDEQPLDPAVLDNWTIKVQGAVNNPFEIKLKDLIAEAPVETTTMTTHCTINPMGGPLLGNCEITGIPLSYIMEKAQVKKSATFLWPYSDDGFTINSAVSLIDANGGYLVYEIDGKPLRHILGYPVQVWVGGAAASSFVKQVTTLEFTEESVKDTWQYSGWAREESGYYNKPNVGVFHLNEGQLIETGKPFTFEGYADSYNLGVDAIEFSFDRGATWTSFATEDTKVGKWVNWSFTFTPETAGAYVMMVRAVASDGTKSDEPIEIMVNAE